MEVSGFPQSAVAGIVLVVLLIVFGTLSVILDHHWSNYGVDPKMRRKVRRAYYMGAGIIFVFILVTAILMIL